MIYPSQLPELNPAYDKSVSYSEYSTFLKCEWMWYLSYGKDLDSKQPSIYTIFGTAIHKTIQHWLEILYNKSVEEANSFEMIEFFNNQFREEYKNEFNKTQSHFSSAIEMHEFFEDGSNILKFVQQNKFKFFNNKNKLLGIEIPLLYKLKKNLYYKGFIDFIIQDVENDRIIIFDIKTSTRGYSEKDKKNEIKISQVLLYKEFFAKQYGVDVDKIDVEYFVVKRKLYENSKFPQSRIQSFSPSSGKLKRKKIINSFENFLKECYDLSGKPIDKKYKKIVSKQTCNYCPFNNTEHCDKKN